MGNDVVVSSAGATPNFKCESKKDVLMQDKMAMALPLFDAEDSALM